MHASHYRFGRFLLRSRTRELLADGQPQRLGERAFDILLALVQAEGGPLTREALFDRAWPGRAVLEDNLKVQVMALRRVLGAEVVLTVPGHGYRLGLPVQVLVEEAAHEAAAPVPDALLGRDETLAQLRAHVAPQRLVTLVGPGGIGKTRLALWAAAHGSLADGHAVVELAPLSDARLLPSTVARALALPPGGDMPAIVAALRPLALLLVLDNAEHLREAVADFACAVLAGAPRVALLVTSQEPLGLAAEQVLRIEGLALPADDTPAAVAASPAAALLVARVRAADARFAPGDTEAAALARVCRRLDGIPLALELAAARVPLLGLAGVLQRLDAALALLTRGAHDAPARQQTLRAALQWSHALLDDAQKAVFRRLAVFAGSFDLDAAQAVAADADADAWSVLDPLQALVDKSFVQVLPQGDGRRLRLLEVTRQFAVERLDDAGEAAATRRRHAEAMITRFEDADARHTRTPTLAWLNGLLPELPNLRSAVEWALDSDERLAVRLCAAAGGFWAMTGLHGESGPPLRRLAARVEQLADTATQARFWLAVAVRGGDYAFSWQETHQAAQRAVALARAAGDGALLHRALGRQLPLADRVGAPQDVAATVAEMRALEGPGWSPLQRRARRAAEAFEWYRRGEWARFGEAERREMQLLREAGDPYRAWFAAHGVALAETALGRPEEALQLMRPVADEIRAAGLARHCWQQMAILALAWIETGRAPAAPVQEAVRLMHGAGALPWIGCHLAEWLQQQGRGADAARLLGWLARRHAERGESPGAHGERARDRALAALRAQGAADQLPAWLSEGEAWSDDDVAAALLAVPSA